MTNMRAMLQNWPPRTKTGSNPVSMTVYRIWSVPQDPCSFRYLDNFSNRTKHLINKRQDISAPSNPFTILPSAPGTGRPAFNRTGRRAVASHSAAAGRGGDTSVSSRCDRCPTVIPRVPPKASRPKHGIPPVRGPRPGPRPRARKPGAASSADLPHRSARRPR